MEVTVSQKFFKIAVCQTPNRGLIFALPSRWLTPVYIVHCINILFCAITGITLNLRRISLISPTDLPLYLSDKPVQHDHSRFPDRQTATHLKFFKLLYT